MVDKGLSSFAVSITFLLMSLVGLCLMPLLSIQLTPSDKSKELFVSYSWPGVSPSIVENQVTSKLEGGLSQIKELVHIESKSDNGYGSITLKFDETASLPALRLQVMSIIRSIYAQLPKGVSRPALSSQGSEAGSMLLNYTITGQGSSQHIEDLLKEQFIRHLSHLEGVYSINVYGGIPYEWHLTYDENALTNYKLTRGDILQAVNNYLVTAELGRADEQKLNDQSEFIYLRLKGNNVSMVELLNIPVKVLKGKMIYLSELAKLTYKESKPSGYFRINGLNKVSLVVNAAKNVNTITLAAVVREKVDELKEKLPKGYVIRLDEDVTAPLKEEIQKLILRVLATLLILLFFVFLVNKEWRFMMVVFFCLLANLLIAFLFYYFLKIEIHLYTLAAIMISLGIIIDNIMIMAEHYLKSGNRQVFGAILASTFATVGGLIIVFFMRDNAMRNMWDFAVVQIVTLMVSLVIVWFMVPSIIQQFSWKLVLVKPKIKKKRWLVRFNNFYVELMRLGIQYRRVFFIMLVIGFGLPLFLLPVKWGVNSEETEVVQPKKWYISWYNNTIGSEFYRTVRKYTDSSLGGTLRWFIINLKSVDNTVLKSDRTEMLVNCYMQPGTTLDQMNAVILLLEDHLSQYREIEEFSSQVSSGENASMKITIKEAYERTGFPTYLKNILAKSANNIGSADFAISGVGKGFTNVIEKLQNSSIELYGYNFEELNIHAHEMRTRLQKYQRIQNVEIKTTDDKSKERSEYVLEPNYYHLALNDLTLSSFFLQLDDMASGNDQRFYAKLNSEYVPLRLKSQGNRPVPLWDVKNTSLNSGKRAFKLFDVVNIGKEKINKSIKKVNQEYSLTVNYDFIGSSELSQMVYDEIVQQTRDKLPVGFRISKPEFSSWSYSEPEQYWYMLIGIIIIFFICSILLNSLLQAIVIVGLIPISYIGIFIAFTVLGVNFDQGGYASFLLLGGQVVVSALFIVNEYNHLLKKYQVSPLKAYLRAWNQKIIPIALTLLSTVLSFVPFFWGDHQESFWYCLGIGTTGGLLFSLIILPFYLPLCLEKNLPAMNKSEIIKPLQRHLNG